MKPSRTAKKYMWLAVISFFVSLAIGAYFTPKVDTGIFMLMFGFFCFDSLLILAVVNDLYLQDCFRIHREGEK